MKPWLNKRILITGGSSGIGLATVTAALAGGAKVSVLTQGHHSPLEVLKSPECHVSYGNLVELEDVQQWLAATKAKLNEIDLIIHCAGLMYYMDSAAPNYQQMKAMVDVNCTGLINLIEAAMPILKQQSQTHWLNITSDAGKQPFAGLAVYSGTKAFVEFTARAMRQELVKYNIKITNIQPGNVDTPLHEKSTEHHAQVQYGSENEGQCLKADNIVKTIEYAISTPHQVAINEILIEPLTESI